MVKVALPRLLPAEMFNVDVPAPVTDVGLNVAVVLRGKPDTLRFTVPAKPLIAPIVTV
jgi:hypothetical protein